VILMFLNSCYFVSLNFLVSAFVDCSDTFLNHVVCFYAVCLIILRCWYVLAHRFNSKNVLSLLRAGYSTGGFFDIILHIVLSR
jgi:sterol desaturase/sphingolipid hydroxylase (fatty acid hydroxylase superfamily)